MKTRASKLPVASSECIELDEAALSAVVGGDDPHWADVDDEGFWGIEIFTVHEIECSDGFCDNIG